MAEALSLPNFRDIGGCAAADGRLVRRELIYRSAVPAACEEHLTRVAALRLGAICDLRSPAEQNLHRWRGPEHATLEWIVAGQDDQLTGLQPIEWLALIADPAFTDRDAASALLGVYRRFPRIYAAHLKSLFAYLASDRVGPVLVHCTAGKDRTGFACAMLLWALGVPRDAIFTDYLMSRGQFSPDAILARLGSRLEQPVSARARAALAVLANVSAEWLDAAFDQIEADFGSVDRYLLQAAGLDAATRERLHTQLLIA